MHQLVENRWFALTDLLFVLVSAVSWMLFPQFGIAFSLIALLPWVVRFLAGQRPFQRTPFDWLIAIFLFTAWVSYWAAYDKSAAGIKFWLLISAVLLYYALSAQPKKNFPFLSFLSFGFAFVLTAYFGLTYNFEGSGGSLAIWWMDHRPQMGWPAIHYDDVLGPILISAILAFYWLWNTSKKSLGSVAIVGQLLLILGIGMVVLVLVLTVSRGIELVSLGAAGLLVLWKALALSESNFRVRAVFPVLVLSYVVVLIVFAYLGPASDIPGSTSSSYGSNSRVELLSRGAYFLVDYPLTGAGLASFPGLYSQYMLVIPFFYFSNSHNLFLDVAIEQGVAAGSIFILLYLVGVLLVSRAIANDQSDELRLLRWMGLFALIITIVHGLFYDYLYNGNGTALLFYPLGMAMMGVVHQKHSRDEAIKPPRALSRLKLAMTTLSILALILVFGVNINRVVSHWYANLGAIQMSQAELKNFPSGRWATFDMVRTLEAAESTFQNALHYERYNQTANHRLGLISMLRQDFKTAAAHLELAHRAAPNHRGIIKSLGYCYVWLGDMDKAQKLLAQIPETQHEMKNYIWWWETQDRPDLSENASIIVSRLGADPQ